MTWNGLATRGFAAPVLALALSGCAAPNEASAASELAPFLVREIPETAHRTFIDFGGKMQLVAYEMTPDGNAGPGQKVNVKLYWRRVSTVAPGWALFTHLTDVRGERGAPLRNLDEVGEFRKWLSGKAPGGLALLELGSVYVDEQSFDMPPAADLVPEVLLVVGAWIQDHPNHYANLPVVSGPSDGHQAGIVSRIDTGLEWPKLAAKPVEHEVRR